MTQRWNLEQKNVQYWQWRKERWPTVIQQSYQTIKGLKEGDSYKYLGVIKTDGTTYHLLKEKLKTE